MTRVKESRGGVGRLEALLKIKKTTLTRAVFWRIPHKTKPHEVHLKIGRYKRTKDESDLAVLECDEPKSELTLDEEELENLIQLLRQNYEPLKAGATNYVSLDELDAGSIRDLRALFRSPDQAKVLQFVLQHKLLPDDIVAAVQHKIRERALAEFEEMLQADAREHDWERWFKTNDWILGSEFVRVLDERRIDASHIADYLMQAYDGFLDLIEIKRPSSELRFWREARDHGNPVPSSHLVAAVSQATTYIYEVEREANSVKFLEATDGVRSVKPRCVLIFGRSHEWDEEERRAYRILNASYHNLTLLTYDHVLERARRILSPTPP